MLLDFRAARDYSCMVFIMQCSVNSQTAERQHDQEVLASIKSVNCAHLQSKSSGEALIQVMKGKRSAALMIFRRTANALRRSHTAYIFLCIFVPVP